MGLLDASSTGTDTVKEPELMAEHRNRENRLVDGRYKKIRNQAAGTTQNRVFLQPRYVNKTHLLKGYIYER
ncbi:hypothetical protein [Marinobacter changyiensis]|uniref:hypothetical protein n=1 Tax=Marinobacter changyiensis TaxID=2604091 RepID=UPI001264DA2A|nr:hypothetical protein [Marinobacter changyiensis]